MPRPAKARERLLDAAEDLLLARGFAETQLDRVRERAGVSKGAIFYHFDGKEALAEAALERFFQRLVTEAQDALAASGATTATARLFAYVDAVATLTRTPALARGCLLGMVTMECTETNPALAAVAADGFTKWQGSLTALIEEAASERGLDVDATGLATTFLAAVEGGLLLDRHRNSPSAVEAALTHFRHYLAFVLQLGKETAP
ncbi:MAG: TetR/AcrR family transcriptional regulator [Thermoleophilia bacterium]|nr:TetR/AcrR family transcriptional regulator [Thermoleophilia bacterium]